MSELVDEFKHTFRNHPSGVAIISANTDEGLAGLTASSVASVSVSPLALAFSVTKSGGSAGKVLSADTFVVNLLGEKQAAVAEAFAHSGAARFTDEQHWGTLPTGEPVLLDAPYALRARALEIIPIGDSRLVAAEVLDVRRGPETAPLLYHDRRFLTLRGDNAPRSQPINA
ncbi:flavin reductase family protein [Pseudoclavibacter soli]|uniref:flavin reductase family protein n=1 Tax=Pseudoclavibacter soli TaxID=452623 RepID=UPI000409BFC2|nr:flavin reductase family protein [Pseudoclavibacter soli]